MLLDGRLKSTLTALRLWIPSISGMVSRSAEFGRNWAYGIGTVGVPKRVKQGYFSLLSFLQRHHARSWASEKAAIWNLAVSGMVSSSESSELRQNDNSCFLMISF